jgi:GNAT superfamily N-acetyltransferase
MNIDEVLAEFDLRMRRDAVTEEPGGRTERVGRVVRATGGEHDWNGVLWSDLDEDSAPAAIAAQIEHFSSLGRKFEWKAYAHDRPAGLPELLLAAGFVSEPPETLMVAEAGKMTEGGTLPAGVRLVPVTDAAGVDLMVDVHDQAFGTNGEWLRQALLTQLTEAPATIVAVVVMAGDTPVSSARMELPPGKEFAGLWGGGTTEAWRGKGLYRALVAHRARIAVERGFRYLQVDALPPSRAILHRLGFSTLSTTTPYIYQPQPRTGSGPAADHTATEVTGSGSA